MGGWMDGWMDGRADGSMDGRMGNLDEMMFGVASLLRKLAGLSLSSLLILLGICLSVCQCFFCNVQRPADTHAQVLGCACNYVPLYIHTTQPDPTNYTPFGFQSKPRKPRAMVPRW